MTLPPGHPARTCPACDGLMIRAERLWICADCAYVRDGDRVCPVCASDMREVDGVMECRACGHAGRTLADLYDRSSAESQAREVLRASQRRGRRGGGRSRGRYPSPLKRRWQEWLRSRVRGGS